MKSLMKSLKQYIEGTINESILDDEDVLLDPERDKEITQGNWLSINRLSPFQSRQTM